jgi:hypothetical protein
MKTGTDYVLRIGYDDNPECPMDFDCAWKLVSFSRDSIHRDDADKYGRMKDGQVVPATIGLRSKFKAGLAFFLDYYEHGTGMYSIHGDGPQCQWDTSSYGGILLWEHKPGEMGAKDFAGRQKDAEQFLETYNAWMNGWVYYFCLDPADHEKDAGNGDSCGGFYEADYMSEVIGESLEAGDRVQVIGDCASVLDESKLP